MLQQKGILFCLSMEGSWRQRNLMFQAGEAINHGLDKEAALSALTLNTAKILGIDATTGSLEPGKDATFILSKGDALDIRTSLITNAFIQGRVVDLDDKQKALFRQYVAKYGIK
jgi:imidazolonepropionase-like amidohydrolase